MAPGEAVLGVSVEQASVASDAVGEIDAVFRAQYTRVAIAGSVLRLRLKLMTVRVVIAGLVPIPWSTSVGSDIMKPVAAPMIGGMVTSTVHVLIITLLIFFITKHRSVRRVTLRVAGLHL